MARNKKDEVVNMFDQAAHERAKEQAHLTAVVTGQAQEKDQERREQKSLRKNENGQIKITLSISEEDRKLIKHYAVENGVSMSDLLHDWIILHCTVKS